MTIQNCKIYHAVELLSGIAAILGFKEDASRFGREAALLKESIGIHLYRSEKKLFADSYGSEHSHPGTQVVAFQYGLVSERDRQKVLDFIVQKGFGCSTLLTLNLLQVLFENGYGQQAFALLNRTEQPGWGYMIAKGYKTIWEGFQDIESHSHAWNAYPARILVEYLVGIKAAAPGFDEILIKPYIPSGMQFAEGKVPSVKGDIFVRWETGDVGITARVALPAGTRAQVFLPGKDSNPDVICGPGEFLIKT